MPQYTHKGKKRLLYLVPLGMIIPGVFLASIPLFAANPADLQDELKSINKKIDSYNEIIDLKQRQRQNLAAQVKTLESQASTLQSEIDKNQQTLGELDENIESLESQISEKERVIIAQKSLLSSLMRSSFENSETSKLQLFFSSNEAVDIMNQDEWTTDVEKKIQSLLENIQSARISLANQKNDLQNKRNEMDSVRYQLEQRNDYLENAKQNKQTLISQTQQDERKYNSLVDDLEEKRKEIEDEIEQLDSAKVGEIDLSQMPAFKKSVLFYPVSKPRITQKYGKASWTKWYSFHNGIDFGGSTGDIIYAADDGTVLATGNQGKYAYGKWIAIDHGNGLVTLYGHLSSQSVSKGEKVKRGEKIGLMGSTGYSTGSHVHFTVFSKKSFAIVPSTKVSGLMLPTGAHVNPANYLP